MANVAVGCSRLLGRYFCLLKITKYASEISDKHVTIYGALIRHRYFEAHCTVDSNDCPAFQNMGIFRHLSELDLDKIGFFKAIDRLTNRSRQHPFEKRHATALDCCLTGEPMILSPQ